MTRTETLALYRPIRASIRRITDLAISVCDRADMMRAAKQLGLWVNGTIVFPDDGAMGMLGDVALFEPNQGGRRAFDRFLSEKAPQLDAADFELAQRMGKAFFSLFRCKGKHEVAGIWLEDLLDEGRSLWLMGTSSPKVFVPAGANHPAWRLTEGAELIAAKWADARKVPQIAFKPDWTKHAKAAPFKRNDQMLELLPIGIIAFPGTGIQDNLADKAKKLGIPVWKFGEGGA